MANHTTIDWIFFIAYTLGYFGMLFRLLTFWKIDSFRPYTDREKKVPWVK